MNLNTPSPQDVEDYLAEPNQITLRPLIGHPTVSEMVGGVYPVNLGPCRGPISVPEFKWLVRVLRPPRGSILTQAGKFYTPDMTKCDNLPVGAQLTFEPARDMEFNGVFYRTGVKNPVTFQRYTAGRVCVMTPSGNPCAIPFLAGRWEVSYEVTE